MLDIRFSPAIPEDCRSLAVGFAPLKRWISRLEDGFDLRSVQVRDVVMFGKRVGFVLAEADVRSLDGQRLPGVAFLRGDSVAILPVLVAPGMDPMVALVRQARVPAGLPDWYEIPAGMLDDGSFVSKAIEEMAEEIGDDIVIREEDLVELDEALTSPGGSDESVKVYAAEIAVDAAALDRLSGRLTGNRHEHEAIAVAVVSLDQVPVLAGRDMKTMLAWHGYRAGLANGLFPERREAPSP